ncbi:cytochrome b [Ensifer sp. IC4062]|nr:cytochrome b [Ensifer sp. IC4062]MCA1441029.1 cytochrome b [Ensifer sp. IC4062]
MLRNSETGFGLVTIVLHWTIALLIFALVLSGFVMQRVEIDPAPQFTLYQWHKSFGFTALGLALLRATWWLVEHNPSPLPSLCPLERRASRVTHDTLTVLAIAVPLAGWAVASTSTLDIPSFYFNVMVIPHLPLAKSEASEDFWTSVHALLAYVTLALAAIHAAAALYHHFMRRDAVLTRMLGSGAPSSGMGVRGAQKRNDTVVGRK